MVNDTRYTVEERGRTWRGTSISVRQAEWEGRPVGPGVFWLFYIYALGFVYRVLVFFMLEFCWSVLVCFFFVLFCFVLVGFGWVCYGVVNVCSFDFFLLRKLAGVYASDQTWRSSLRSHWSFCVCPLVRGGVFIFLIFLLKIAVAMAHGLRQNRLRCRHQAPCSSCETCYI